jgi:excisionase family DNA binding protein
MKSDALPTDLIAIPEAAKILRVHVTSVYRYVMRRQLPAYKVGGRYWLSRGDVLGFVQRTGPGEEGGGGAARAGAVARRGGGALEEGGVCGLVV